MARRKSHGGRKHHRRHRRMGAIGGLDLKTPLATAAGAVGGTFLINGPLKTMSWINIAAMAGGIAVAKFGKSQTMGAVGAGLFAAGAISMLQNSGIISGIPGKRVGRVFAGIPGGPISSVAGVPGVPGQLNYRQANAENVRRAAAGKKRVIMGQGAPISSVAGFDDHDL